MNGVTAIRIGTDNIAIFRRVLFLLTKADVVSIVTDVVINSHDTVNLSTGILTISKEIDWFVRDTYINESNSNNIERIIPNFIKIILNFDEIK